MSKLSIYMLKSQKARMDYSRHDIYTCNHVEFTAQLKHLSPDRAQKSKLLDFRWFQSKALKNELARRNKSKNIVTRGKRCHLVSKR